MSVCEACASEQECRERRGHTQFRRALCGAGLHARTRPPTTGCRARAPHVPAAPLLPAALCARALSPSAFSFPTTMAPSAAPAADAGDKKHAAAAAKKAARKKAAKAAKR